MQSAPTPATSTRSNRSGVELERHLTRQLVSRHSRRSGRGRRPGPLSDRVGDRAPPSSVTVVWAYENVRALLHGGHLCPEHPPLAGRARYSNRVSACTAAVSISRAASVTVSGEKRRLASLRARWLMVGPSPRWRRTRSSAENVLSREQAVALVDWIVARFSASPTTRPTATEEAQATGRLPPGNSIADVVEYAGGWHHFRLRGEER
jgi:hypothetical protein